MLQLRVTIIVLYYCASCFLANIRLSSCEQIAGTGDMNTKSEVRTLISCYCSQTPSQSAHPLAHFATSHAGGCMETLHPVDAPLHRRDAAV